MVAGGGGKARMCTLYQTRGLRCGTSLAGRRRCGGAISMEMLVEVIVMLIEDH